MRKLFCYQGLKTFLNEPWSDISLFGYMRNWLLTRLLANIFSKPFGGALIFPTDTIHFGKRSSTREAAETTFPDDKMDLILS
ncbi:MAG: hypothetical protein NVS4B11_24810 [Ktedonobacteraceae bacterium]